MYVQLTFCVYWAVLVRFIQCCFNFFFVGQPRWPTFLLSPHPPKKSFYGPEVEEVSVELSMKEISVTSHVKFFKATGLYIL